MPVVPVQSGLSKSLAKEGVKKISRIKVWAGPTDSGPTGGITQSLLGRFLVCRDRFRLRVIEGLDSTDRFNHRLEYGNMWHVCEEYNHAGKNWEAALKEYAKGLADRHRTQGAEVLHWYEVCKRQFKAYLLHNKKLKLPGVRESVMQEKVFHVPYELPWSGRVVWLRGKWDGAHILSKCREPKPGLWLDENKTKGDIDEQLLVRQLTFDLQTMFYAVAFNQWITKGGKDMSLIGRVPELQGVRYNVVRRPLSGGKGSIRQKKGQTPAQFYDQLEKDYLLKMPAHYFLRWNVTITEQDLLTFRKVCLDPVLEQLCDWWDLQQHEPQVDGPTRYSNFRFPYGVYNVLTEGGATQYDEYLATGNAVGLRRNAPLFQELA